MAIATRPRVPRKPPNLIQGSFGSAGSNSLMDAQRSLDRFFLTPKSFYFESELVELAGLLKNNRMYEWAQVPKLYFVLRCVGQQQAISAFVSQGIVDMSAPFENEILSSLTGRSDIEFITRFREYQHKIMSHHVSVYRESLDNYFSAEFLATEQPIGDSAFNEIARLLEFCGEIAAAKSPKLYFVLRVINELESLPDFHAKGYDDVWFPFPKKILVAIWVRNPPSRNLFLKLQKRVLSTRWSEHVHMNFGDDDQDFIEHRKELGTGGTGEVDHVYCSSSQKEYARKIILRTTTGLRYFSNEIAVLKSVSHRHCVSLVGSYTDPFRLAILCQPVADMNLATLLDATPIAADRKAFLESSFGCLSVALRYLHSKDIRHKDIKPQNILIHGNCFLLTDFGLSAEEVKNMTTTGSKTSRYCSPEVEDGGSRSFESDIWSLGCVFFEILAVLSDFTMDEVKRYFQEHGSSRIHFNANLIAVTTFLEDECTFEKLKEYSPMVSAAKGLTAEMTIKDFEKRPTADALVSTVSKAFRDAQNTYGQCCSEDMTNADNYPPQSLLTEKRSHPGINTPINEIGDPKAGLDKRSQNVDNQRSAEKKWEEQNNQLAMESQEPNDFSSLGQSFGRGKYDQSPMHSAAANGQIAMVDHLCSLGQDISIKDKNGETPMHYAAGNGQIAMVDYLRSLGQDINIRDNEGDTPMYSAVITGEINMVDHLYSLGGDINMRDERGGTSLHFAAYRGQITMFNHLRSLGQDINTLNDDGETPMHYAAASGQIAMVDHLRSLGQSIYARDKDGDTPIYCAVMNGKINMFDHLRILGQDINIQNNHGAMLIHHAARKGHITMVDHLRSLGQDINIQDNDGETPMHYAAANGQISMVSHLHSLS